MDSRPIEPVVAGVDGTLASVHAVDLAAEEAAARVAPLVVVYTVEPRSDPALLRGHRRLLDLVVSRAQAEHPGISVRGDLVYGQPVEALVRWSARAGLLVLGHRAGRRDEPSVAAEVASRSVAPVIVYRPLVVPQSGDCRPVLVGVSGRVGEDAPVAFAFQEAELRGAPVVACYVQTPYVPGSTVAQARELLAGALGIWSDKYPEVTVRYEVRFGYDVVDVLAEVSRVAGLAVVGADGQRVPDRVGLGPTARGLIDVAGCPVAVVSEAGATD